MGSYTEIKNTNKIINNLSAIYYELVQQRDKMQAQKLIDLIEKIKEQELVIGFAGHFSAGKSTMINELVGEDILPSSPIPTSANVVRLKSGNEYVRIFYSNGEVVQINEVYDMDAIKTLSKDGETVKAIELSKSIANLPNHVSIMDTPGIDSSNDADRIITEANLHLVDVLFYVMDYNHVQSEVNLAFLREMQNKGKNFYLVINQIDKHQDDELFFDAFQSSVNQALISWGIYPKGVFYTSLKDPNHIYNEFNQLKLCFLSLTKKVETEIEKTIIHSTETIIHDHLLFLKNERQNEIDDLEDRLHSLKTDLQGADLQHLSNITEDDSLDKGFKVGIETILKNAYLMPYENRELAKEFLQSQQSSFKAGGLFAKKKTKQIKAERFDLFYEALVETSSRQMEMHIRELLLKQAKENLVTNEEMLKKLQSFHITYDKNNLTRLIKHGAEVTGDYVLVYTDEVVVDIKRNVKRDCMDLWEKLYNVIKNNAELEKRENKILIDHFEQLEEVQQTLEEIGATFDSRKIELKSILLKENNDETSNNKLILDELKHRESKIVHLDKLSFNPTNKTKSKSENRLANKDLNKAIPRTAEDTIEVLESTHQLIDGLKGFTSISEDLKKKRDRLENRHFTVALFGAFSAGKSSFANALLGEGILPVSPNPTTATINKISPPIEEYPHGSVLVQFKSERQLIEDVQFILKENSQDLTTLEELVEWLSSNELEKLVDKKGTKNLSFLQALVSGYENTKENIGKEIVISIDNANAYIAEEKFACYVEWMETFYDCSFTKNGITLVDTPGADSVNARHTEVAFEYIKDADAILFVTYYNHAFSRADREFLLQLGRVKDIFSLDKMFFIINASDLAKNDEELMLVQEYVEDQLLQFGIRNPRMFSLSSKLALQQRSNGIYLETSGVDKFEKQFRDFINNELTQLFIQSAFYDIHRVEMTLEKYIQTASMNKAEKAKLNKQYKIDQEKLINLIELYETNRFEQAIQQELEELFYYIHQRIFLRFNDFFKEAINPATIKSNGKKGSSEIHMAFDELLMDIDHSIIQELQATSLRVDTFMKKCYKDFIQEIESYKEVRAYGITFSDDIEVKFEYPHFQVNLKETDDGTYQKPLRLFKNTKSFFELNEKEIMKDSLEEILKPVVKNVLNEKEKELAVFFQPQWEKELARLKNKMMMTIQEYFDGLLFNISDQVNIEKLKEIHNKIREQSRL